eukprot:2638372-Pleurochrysis_carterae.AAC.1
MSASISARLPGGHRRTPSACETCSPRAVTGSPTTTFAGAAWSPNSARPSTAICACACALVPSAAGTPPPARVCTGSMRAPRSSS